MGNGKYKALELTEEERQAVERYAGTGHMDINGLMEGSGEVLGYVAGQNRNFGSRDVPTFNHTDVERAMSNIALIYSAMYKNMLRNPWQAGGWRVFRGTTVEDVDRIKGRGGANKFLSATSDREMAEGYFSLNWKNPASITITARGNVPYIDMADVIEGYEGSGNGTGNWEKETLLAPFLNVECTESGGRQVECVTGPKTLRRYNFEVSKRDLPDMNEQEREELRGQVFGSIEQISAKRKEAILLPVEIEDKRWQLGRRREDLEKFSRELRSVQPGDKGYKDIKGDVDFLRNELIPQLEGQVAEMQQRMSQCNGEVSEWTQKFVTLCQTECRQAELAIDKSLAQEKEQEQKAKSQEPPLRRAHAQSRTEAEIPAVPREQEQLQQQYRLDVSDIHEALRRVGAAYFNLDGHRRGNLEILNEAGIGTNTYYSYINELAVIPRIQRSIGERVGRLGMGDADLVHSVSREISRGVLDEKMLKDLEENSLKKSFSDKIETLICSASIMQLMGRKAELIDREIKSKGGLRGLLRTKGVKQEQASIEREKEGIDGSVAEFRARLGEITNSSNKAPTKTYSVHSILADIAMFINENERTQNPEIRKYIEEAKKMKDVLCSTFVVNETRCNKEIVDKYGKMGVQFPAKADDIIALRAIKLRGDRHAREAYESRGQREEPLTFDRRPLNVLMTAERQLVDHEKAVDRAQGQPPIGGRGY